jgi:hypothetical protein
VLTGSVLGGFGFSTLLVVLCMWKAWTTAGYNPDYEDLLEIFLNGYLFAISVRLVATILYLVYAHEPIGPYFFEDDKLYIFIFGILLGHFSARRIFRILSK